MDVVVAGGDGGDGGEGGRGEEHFLCGMLVGCEIGVEVRLIVYGYS